MRRTGNRNVEFAIEIDGALKLTGGFMTSL
jgi:hypothetical protein